MFVFCAPEDAEADTHSCWRGSASSSRRARDPLPRHRRRHRRPWLQRCPQVHYGGDPHPGCTYREITSTSNTTEPCARRLRIPTRDADGTRPLATSTARSARCRASSSPSWRTISSPTAACGSRTLGDLPWRSGACSPSSSSVGLHHATTRWLRPPARRARCRRHPDSPQRLGERARAGVDRAGAGGRGPRLPGNRVRRRRPFPSPAPPGSTTSWCAATVASSSASRRRPPSTRSPLDPRPVLEEPPPASPRRRLRRGHERHVPRHQGVRGGDARALPP